MQKNNSLSEAQSQSLRRIWRRTVEKTGDEGHWEADLSQLFALGLGMEEVLRELYTQRPSLEQFISWAEQQAPTTIGEEPESSSPLREEDLEHWKEHGYVVLRNAVPAAVHEAAARAIWDYLDADPQDPESWYRDHPGKNGMMLHLTRHPALARVRRSPRIRKAYEQLYGTDRIYTVVDKVSFNPPQTKLYSFRGSPLHWDTSLALPLPDRFQGLLYLTDTAASEGSFHCVPGFHRIIGDWLASVPQGTSARDYAVNQLKAEPVAGNAGDFIIWHSALPHCATANTGRTPRLVQYLTYLPEGFSDRRPWI